MERETRLSLFFIIIIIIIFIVIWKYLQTVSKEKDQIKTIKLNYDQAILRGDRQRALQLGREYYSLLRGGKLTIYDEQAIANDLSTIITKA